MFFTIFIFKGISVFKSLINLFKRRRVDPVEVTVVNNTAMDIVIERRWDNSRLSLHIRIKDRPELGNTRLNSRIDYHDPGSGLIIDPRRTNCCSVCDICTYTCTAKTC